MAGEARAQYIYDLEDDHRPCDSALSDVTDLDPGNPEAVLDELYRHIAIEALHLFGEVNRSCARPW